MKKLLLILSFSFCFPSFANDHIKSLEDGFCYQANTAQIRNNRYFLPNESKPFSGENLCIYAKNGQYHSKGELIDGLQNGWWTWWKVNGELSRTEEYENGEKIGYKRIALNENGYIERERIYQNNNLIAESKYEYYPNGRIQKEALFQYEEKVSEIEYTYYSNGQIKKKVNFL